MSLMDSIVIYWKHRGRNTVHPTEQGPTLGSPGQLLYDARRPGRLRVGAPSAGRRCVPRGPDAGPGAAEGTRPGAAPVGLWPMKACPPWLCPLFMLWTVAGLGGQRAAEGVRTSA